MRGNVFNLTKKLKRTNAQNKRKNRETYINPNFCQSEPENFDIFAELELGHAKID